MTSITTSNYWSGTNIAGKLHIMEIQEKEKRRNIILTEKNKIIFLESCNYDIT
jgi:hypothetical protein